MPRKSTKWSVDKNTVDKFHQLKGLKATELFVFLSKLSSPNKSQQELADEFGISQQTVSNYIRRVQDSEFLNDCKAGLNKLKDLLLLSIEANLLDHNPLVTIKMAEGMGLWKTGVVLELPKSKPEEFEKDVVGTGRRLLERFIKPSEDKARMPEIDLKGMASNSESSAKEIEPLNDKDLDEKE